MFLYFFGIHVNIYYIQVTCLFYEGLLQGQEIKKSQEKLKKFTKVRKNVMWVFEKIQEKSGNLTK